MSFPLHGNHVQAQLDGLIYLSRFYGHRAKHQGACTLTCMQNIQESRLGPH